MRRGAPVAVLVFSLLACPALAGVRVRLVSGGTLIGDRAWAEDGNLLLESSAGVVGFPLELVAAVESADGKEPTFRPSGAPPADDVSATAEAAPAALQEAIAALTGGDVDRAALLFHRILQEAPGAVDARIGYGLAEMARGRDPVALATVLDGLVIFPDDPGLLEILGDLRNREERVEDAIRAWTRAGRVAPHPRLEEKIAKAQRELAAGRDYAFATTSHFTIRHEGDLPREFTSAIVDRLEEQWVELTSSLRHAPSQPVTVILYPDRAFRDVTRAPDEVGGIYDGKIRFPLGGVRRMDPLLDRLLRHELTHAILHSKTRGQAPRWLQEGLAQRLEPRSLPASRLVEIRGAILAGEPGTWHERAFSYPAALALVQWLESERGFSALVSTLERLGEGASLDAAFSSVYGQSYGELCRRWGDSLRDGGPR